MDRNKLIGLILISAILILLTHFWGPKPTPISSQEQSSPTTQTMPSGSLKPLAQDSAQQPGAFTQSIQDIAEQEVTLENKDVKVTLTSQGGTIKEVVLKNYLDHQGLPLVLVDAQSNQMGFQFTTNQVEINTSQLPFEPADKHQYVSGEELGKATFTWTLGPGQYIRQVFSLPSQGYELTQYWDIVGLESSIDQGAIGFIWHDLIKRAEKDLEACRSKSTINYYLADNSFKYLKERSDKQEIQTIEKPIKWVGIKQRFFTAGIVADEAFTNSRLALNPTLQSDSIVKEAQVWLSLPAAKDQKNRQGKFLFYFGPNDYKILKKFTLGFSKNLPLGWPVVKWINQFLILPIFSFLEQYVSNYGIIILSGDGY